MRTRAGRKEGVTTVQPAIRGGSVDRGYRRRLNRERPDVCHVPNGKLSKELIK
jgi:hypothetical protein